MAKYKKRKDGRYESKVNLGVDENGKYIRKAVYGRTIDEIDEKIRQVKNEHEKGVDVMGDKPTVKEWADKWLELYKPSIKRSQRAVYEAVINKWLEPIHSTKIDKVKPSELQGILLNASNELAQSTVDKIYNCIRGIFLTARKNGYTAYDLSEPLTKPTGGKKTKREALTEKEKEILIKACKKEPLGALPMIMMFGGLRIGEALALTWGDIGTHIDVNKTLTYEVNSNKAEIKHSPKSDAGFRKVPIVKPLKPFLDKLNSDGIYLFTNKGKLYSKTVQRSRWNKLMDAFKAEWYEAHKRDSGELTEVIPEPRKITAHMLRHTYITMLYDAGVDVKTAQRWAGHATVSVLMDIYTHLSETKEKEAIDKLQAYVSDDIFDDNDDKKTTQFAGNSGKQ